MSRDLKLNILLAYPYFSDKNIEELSRFDRSKYRLIVDSGAFTAWNTGKIIRFEDYCKFLDRIKFLKYDAAVQLDVVFNPEETQKNFQRHLDRGDDVCPVFTRGDSWEYMEKLIADDRYVFVGGVQKGDGAKEFAKYCLERTKGKKIHYLAFIRSDWLNHYKPYSVDASTWASSARFGLLKLYTNGGRVTNLTKLNFIRPPSKEIKDHLYDIGFDNDLILALGKKSSWDTNKFNFFKGKTVTSLHTFGSICSYIKYSVEAQNVIGTKIYLAFGNDHYTRMFIFAYDWLLQRGKL